MSFANRPGWSRITESMLIKKDVQNCIAIEPYSKHQNFTLQAKKIKKDRMTVDKAQQIIRKGLSNQIAFKIIDLKNLKEI